MRRPPCPQAYEKKAGTIKYTPEYSTMNAAEQNLTKTNRKVTRNLKYVANHARVQLPSAGTGLSSPSAAREEGSGKTRTNVHVLAPGEACGTGHSSMSRERLVLAPGINKPQGGRSLVSAPGSCPGGRRFKSCPCNPASRRDDAGRER